MKENGNESRERRIREEEIKVERSENEGKKE
jgi:hypothetical protein